MIAVIVLASTALTLVLGAALARASPRRLHQSSAELVGPTSGSRSRQQSVLVEMVERTSRDVRSGTALRVALLDATRDRPDLLPTLHQQLARGVPVGLALEGLGTLPSKDAEFVVHGLQLAVDTGGAMADTLDRVVAVVRERQAWRAERHAQAAQARLSARVLTVLPPIVAVWGIASGPRVRHAYAQSPATAVLTGIGVALNLVGWWWMSRLVRERATA
jgi:tight adherence protein B